jgi:hypothetical protein
MKSPRRKPYSFAARAAEKAASRAQDEADLASGRKSREDLWRENGAFAFPPSMVRIEYPGRKF